jgi:hypothetical protein
MCALSLRMLCGELAPALLQACAASAWVAPSPSLAVVLVQAQVPADE